MSRLAPSCHVMSHHVTSYHFESRGTVTQPTLHCQLTSSTRNQFKLSMTVFVGCLEGCRYHTASAVYDLVFFSFFLFFFLFFFFLFLWGATAPPAPQMTPLNRPPNIQRFCPPQCSPHYPSFLNSKQSSSTGELWI